MLGFNIGGSVTNTNTTGTNSTFETNNQTGSNATQSTNTSSGLSKAIQDPLATNFRNGLFASYDSAINHANTPIYGTGFLAGQEGQNALAAQQSSDSLKQKLAASGMLDSGQLTAGETGIQNNLDNTNAQLRANLPAMEAQAQAARLQPLLSGAGSLAGQAPISTETTGQQIGDQTSQSSLDDIINQIIKSSMSGTGISAHAGIG